MVFEKLRKFKYFILFTLVIAIIITLVIYFQIAKNHEEGKKIILSQSFGDFHSKYIRQNFKLDPSSLRNRKKLSNAINSEIKKLQIENKAKNISLFFTDLSTMMRIDINSNIKYTPASLLKLPLMIAGLKLAETSPSILTKKYLFTHDYAEKIEPSITGTKKLEIGKEYTYDDILKYAIIYSDNRAALLLRNILMSINMEIYREIFTNFDMELPDELEDHNIEFLTSANDIGRFFRILYNCNYLSPKYSEYALKILVSSEYKKGLSKYLPPKTEIAHKFGAYAIGSRYEMHDCGIVYAGDSPYILSIMTRGTNFDDLSEVIGRISKIVYDEIKK